MPLIYKTGNLIDAPEPIIIHGCNAQGVMGSGVAKAIREAYPTAYEAYQEVYDTRGLNPGEVVWAWVNYPEDEGQTRLIGNAITQRYYGKDGHRYVNYDAVEVAFRVAADALREDQDMFNIDGPYVAIPRIGAGLGGGDWDIIAERIETAMEEFDVVVYDLE